MGEGGNNYRVLEVHDISKMLNKIISNDDECGVYEFGGIEDDYFHFVASIPISCS